MSSYNRYTVYKPPPPLIKYNAQSSPYNQAMQNNYINNIGVHISDTSGIEDTSDFVKKYADADRQINPYLITKDSENNMTAN